MPLKTCCLPVCLKTIYPKGSLLSEHKAIANRSSEETHHKEKKLDPNMSSLPSNWNTGGISSTTSVIAMLNLPKSIKQTARRKSN